MTWDRREIGLDWLRVSFPEGCGHLKRLIGLMEKRFGPGDDCNGRHSYRTGLVWPNKSRIWWANSGMEETLLSADPSCCVEINGQTLSALEANDRLSFARQVSMGGKGRRVDIALDFFHDQHVGLIQAMQDACRQGEVCGFRKSAPVEEYEQGKLTGYGFTAGGKTSEKTVCCYDKGLQTGEQDKGRWERLEMRWNGDAAELVLQQVLAGSNHWQTAFDLICGGISFRERPSGKGRHLKRRPMKAFWKQVTEGGSPMASVPKRAQSTLGEYGGWVRKNVVPTLMLLAEEMDSSFDAALRYLMEGFAKPAPASAAVKKRLLFDFRKLMETRPPKVSFG